MMLEREPVTNWRNCLVNDFETNIFEKYPQIKNLKQELYSTGAVYASMSGSGSAVYALFNSEPDLNLFKHYQHCLQKPATTIL